MNLRVITAAWGLAFVWATSTLALFTLTSLSRAADPAMPPTTQQPDQLLLATAPQMKDLATAWADCSLGRMIQGADMQPFRAELDKNDVGSLLRLRPWFGWDWAELADVSGNVTFNIFSIHSCDRPCGNSCGSSHDTCIASRVCLCALEGKR